MDKKFNVIKITGLKGLFIAAFIVGCLIAGFLIFPGWVSMHIWNFTAGFFNQMPVMTLIHGILLWCIVALSLYALNQGDFAISFGHSSPMPGNEERIKEILRQINEKNAGLIPLEKDLLKKNDEKINNDDSHEEENDDKIAK